MSYDLIVAAPDTAHGMPVGTGDWQIAFEIALPEEDAALYDVAEYDDAAALYSLIEWEDITDYVRGVNWFRGSDDPGGRPRTGTAELHLDNRDQRWTPWTDSEPLAVYYAPGTMIRWGTWEHEIWIPQFTGIVETWIEETAAFGRENRVAITLIETVGRLGTIDNNAVSAVGTGDTAGQRVERLLDAASWTYGFYDEADTSITLQSTEMTANRLAELHLVADSVDVWFRSHRSGIAMLEAVDPDNHPDYNPPDIARYDTAEYDTALYGATEDLDWAIMRAASYFYSGITLRPVIAEASDPDVTGRVDVSMVYDGDSLVPLNDLDLVINDVRLARDGGTQQTAQDVLSMGRYGQRSYARSDLLNSSDADVLAVAEAILDRRAYKVLRVESVELFGRPENLQPMMVIDLGDPVRVVLSDNVLAVAGHVISIEHSITPRTPNAVLWTTTLGLETDPGFVDAA